MYFIKKYKRGVFVKYRKGMPMPEKLAKDTKYLLKMFLNLLRHGFTVKTIYVYPHYPSSGSTLYKIADHLGYNLTNIYHSHPDIIVYWEYLTFRKEYHHLENIDTRHVVNLHSRDISKVFVDNIFKEVFGYSTSIDPMTYDKPYVKKSDINARHDGEIVDRPGEVPAKGFIYQKLIDNSTDNNQVVDLRVPVIGETLSFIYLKYRDKSIRFTNSTSKTILTKTKDVFSDIEIEKINQFCNHINLDYGELDILRDNNDGKIYIVDVNNTPQGPPRKMACRDEKHAIRALSQAFKNHFLLT